MSPLRQRNRLVYPVALACVAVMLLASCHGSSKAVTGSSSTVPSTNAKGQPRVSLALKLGTLQIEATNAPIKFNPATAQAILKLVNSYIKVGIAEPLFTGRLSTGIVRDFSSSLVSRVGPKGVDRKALTDEHAPVITDVTGTVKAPLNLVGLQENGKLLMIGAAFGLTVKGTTAQGPMNVTRIGHFVFEMNAAKQWRISGYDIVVRRGTKRATTTQKATTTTAAK